jgi:acetyl esterase
MENDTVALDVARPDVRAFLDALNASPGPRLHERAPDDARLFSLCETRANDLRSEPIEFRRELTIPTAYGDLPARFYDPREGELRPGPLVLFFHGGGFVIGDLASYESAAIAIAMGLDLPVLSIGYRLAPENPWPAAPDDCEAAARWIAGRGTLFGRQFKSLALAGDSAGGTLSIVTAMALRDEPAALPVKALGLLYPAIDLRKRTPSTERFGKGHMIELETLRWFNEAYAPDFRHWRASPGLGKFAGLPPTLVGTAALDPLLDQGRGFAVACVEAGVPVACVEASGNIHGWLTLRKAIPSSQGDLSRWLALFAAMLKDWRS